MSIISFPFNQIRHVENNMTFLTLIDEELTSVRTDCFDGTDVILE